MRSHAKRPPSGGLFLCAFLGGRLDSFLRSFLCALLLLLLAAGEIGADVLRRMPDGSHRCFQSRRRDLELLRPVADFVGLAQRDPRPVGPAALLLVVRHPCSPVVLRKSTLQT